MKRSIRLFSFLGILSLLIVPTPFGNNEDTPPALIQTLLKKEGATLADLQTDSALREQLRQHLYQMQGKRAPKLHIQRQMPQRSFVKLPPHCQVIIDNNLFRPLGYRKYEWTLKLELIGTVIYADTEKNTAILQSNHPKYRRLIVKNGDRFLEELTLTQIQVHQITYTNKEGKQQYLRLRSPFGAGNLGKPETDIKHDL